MDIRGLVVAFSSPPFSDIFINFFCLGYSKFCYFLLANSRHSLYFVSEGKGMEFLERLRSNFELSLCCLAPILPSSSFLSIFINEFVLFSSLPLLGISFCFSSEFVNNHSPDLPIMW